MRPCLGWRELSKECAGYGRPGMASVTYCAWLHPRILSLTRTLSSLQLGWEGVASHGFAYEDLAMAFKETPGLQAVSLDEAEAVHPVCAGDKPDCNSNPSMVDDGDRCCMLISGIP